MGSHPVLWLVFAGIAGFGLGLGLVVGVFLAGAFRRYLRGEADGD